MSEKSGNQSRRWRSMASRSTVGALALGILIPFTYSVLQRDQPSISKGREQARDRMVARLATKRIKKPQDQPQEAMNFYWAKRSPNGQGMSISQLEEAAAAAARLPVYSSALGRVLGGASPAVRSVTGASTLNGSWQPHGPGNIGGRSRELLISYKNENVMWTAGVAGGIWKSTDGGASWQPKGDLLVNIAVNSIVQDSKQPDVLYAGTGEGFFNGDAVRGQGIFKSTDAGETWKQLASTDNTDFQYVQRIVATRHKKKQRIYAATRTGVFRSSDYGDSWTKVLDATGVNGCMDMVIQPHKEDYVFASCGTLAQATVWRALDVEVQTWEPVLSNVDMGRTSLAIAPSNSSVIYALASFYHLSAAHPQDYALLAVYRSTQDGAAGTWETRVHYTDSNKLNTVQLTNPVYAHLADCGFGASNQFFNQGWYDNQIAVDPKDENIVWTAGVDLMRSNDGGQTWGVASYWWFDSTDPLYAHADNHAITFHPKFNGASNRKMFVASDGGIYGTNDSRAPVGTTLASVCGDPVANQVSWTSYNNGYQVTQFYHGTVWPDGSTFFGGTQDNGSVIGGLAGGPDNWQDIRGGDGGYVAVDRDDTDIIYGEYTGKSLQRSMNGGASWANIHTGVTEASGNYQFIHPFAMDPSNTQRLWYGGASAWRSNNRGTSWTRASASFASRIASWGISPTDPDRVYVGVQHLGTTTSGRIFTTNAATTVAGLVVWPSAQPRQGYVSSIGVDPTNPLVAYATYSTYNFGTNLGHVFKTADGGATWTRIDLSLPDMPVHSVVVHPTQSNTIYIGTDVGVFVTIDGGVGWMRENTGFANVVTEHLQLNNGRLFAFTHGRSAWSVDLAD